MHKEGNGTQTLIVHASNGFLNEVTEHPPCQAHMEQGLAYGQRAGGAGGGVACCQYSRAGRNIKTK